MPESFPDWLKTMLDSYGYLGIAAVCFAIGGWLVWTGLRSPSIHQKFGIIGLGLGFIVGGYIAYTTLS